ncbi:MAG: MlaD family protein [Spirochaetia bacterium]|nr:MlaD family protein [Spirochaetia bacterium]
MNWFQNILVGILFFGALALAGFFTIVSESGPFAKKGNQTVLYFDNADGIKIGSRVTVLGVPAGTVTDLSLIGVDDQRRPVAEETQAVAQRVAVTIELKRPVKFYSNYKIAVKNETILSGKIIAIDPGSIRAGEDGKIPEVVKVLAPSTSELQSESKTALQHRIEKGAGYTDLQGESSGDPLAGLSEVLAENRTDIRRTLNNVAEITTKINQGKGTVGLLINDDELHRNANTVLTDAQIVVRELRESLEDTREQAPVNSFLRAALTAF